MGYLTMQQLKSCGFKAKRTHNWGANKVQLHEKGNIQIETTSTNKGEVVTQEMYIANIDVNFGVEDLKTLDKILNS